eukprot:742515-Amphidinium_carterae.1
MSLSLLLPWISSPRTPTMMPSSDMPSSLGKPIDIDHNQHNHTTSFTTPTSTSTSPRSTSSATSTSTSSNDVSTNIDFSHTLLNDRKFIHIFQHSYEHAPELDFELGIDMSEEKMLKYLKLMNEHFCSQGKEYKDTWTDCDLHTETPCCDDLQEDFEGALCTWKSEHIYEHKLYHARIPDIKIDINFKDTHSNEFSVAQQLLRSREDIRAEEHPHGETAPTLQLETTFAQVNTPGGRLRDHLCFFQDGWQGGIRTQKHHREDHGRSDKVEACQGSALERGNPIIYSLPLVTLISPPYCINYQSALRQHQKLLRRHGRSPHHLQRVQSLFCSSSPAPPECNLLELRVSRHTELSWK